MEANEPAHQLVRKRCMSDMTVNRMLFFVVARPLIMRKLQSLVI